MAILDWIIRLKLHDDEGLKRHIEKASSWFVDTLAEAWRNVKADKPKDRLQIMTRLHYQKLCLVFEQPVLDAVYASLDHPGDVMEQTATDWARACFRKLCNWFWVPRRRS